MINQMKIVQLIKKRKIDKKWLSSHVKQITIAVVVITAIVGVALTSTSIAANDNTQGKIQGMIEAKDVSLNSKIPGRISEIYVVEGQKVNVGDPLVAIASEELEAKKLQLLAQISQAEAGVVASQAIVEMAESNYNIAQERISQAEAGVKASESQRDMAGAVSEKAQNGARTQQVAQAESAYLLMQSTYERASILYDGGAISFQRLEEIRTQRDIYEQTFSMAKEGSRTEDKAAATAQFAMAQAGVTASNAVLSQALEASNIAIAQVNQANAGLQASQGKLEQAKAGLQEIEVYLKDSVISSPIAGTVTTLNSDEGELVSTGSSIGTVSNLETCWVNVNMDEDKLTRISEGQSVSINLLTYPGKTFEGTIVTINKQPDFAIKKATNENGNFDIVSFGVKIELANQKEIFRPGMTAIVDFDSVEVK